MFMDPMSVSPLCESDPSLTFHTTVLTYTLTVLVWSILIISEKKIFQIVLQASKFSLFQVV